MKGQKLMKQLLDSSQFSNQNSLIIKSEAIDRVPFYRCYEPVLRKPHQNKIIVQLIQKNQPNRLNELNEV